METFLHHGNKRMRIVDDQTEIHDDFVEMLQPSLVEAATDDLADAFVLEEDQSFLPEFLHVPRHEERQGTANETLWQNRRTPLPRPTSRRRVGAALPIADPNETARGNTPHPSPYLDNSPAKGGGSKKR